MVEWFLFSYVGGNEYEVGFQFKMILKGKEDTCAFVDYYGSWSRERVGNGVLGPPDFTWTQDGATRASICVKVKTPGQISTLVALFA